MLLRTSAAAAARIRGRRAGPVFLLALGANPFRTRAGQRRTAIAKELSLIILGIILLIIGFVAKIAIIWAIGIIVLIVGAILALLGMLGHAVGGRRHYF
jgi:hypothetical protein